MKRAILFCALLALLMGTNAQETTSYKEKHPYKDWVKIAPKLDDAFLTTPEAIRIADNVLLYQHTTGGWPKNVYMPAELTADEYKKVLAAKNNVNESTIDNSATSTEIRYLSRIYLATRIEKYKDAALEGIRYLLKAPILATPQGLLHPHHLQRQCNGERDELTARCLQQESAVHLRTGQPLPTRPHRLRQRRGMYPQDSSETKWKANCVVRPA